MSGIAQTYLIRAVKSSSQKLRVIPEDVPKMVSEKNSALFFRQSKLVSVRMHHARTSAICNGHGRSPGGLHSRSGQPWARSARQGPCGIWKPPRYWIVL